MRTLKRLCVCVSVVTVVTVVTVSHLAYAGEKVGLLPLRVARKLKLPLSIDVIEDSIAKGLATSGREVVPSSEFRGNDLSAAVAKVGADFFVRTSVDDAGREGVRVTLGLFSGAGAKLNDETVTCLAPDCSLGGVVRLLAKELVRTGLEAQQATPVVAEEKPMVSAPVAVVAIPTIAPPPQVADVIPPLSPQAPMTPTWVWPVAGGGVALIATGAVLWSFDGKGQDCKTLVSGGEACLRENSTKAAGAAAMAVGGVSVVAAVTAFLLHRHPSPEERVSISPTSNGLQLHGRF